MSGLDNALGFEHSLCKGRAVKDKNCKLSYLRKTTRDWFYCEIFACYLGKYPKFRNTILLPKQSLFFFSVEAIYDL